MPATKTQSSKHTSARETIAHLWRQERDAGAEFATDEAVARIVVDLLADDSFLLKFAVENLPYHVRQGGYGVLAKRSDARPVVRGKIDPARVRESVRAEIETMRQEDSAHFASWMEIVPSDNTKIPLTSMTKTQVLNAAHVYHDRGLFAIGRSKWLAQIANKMDGNFQVVSDVWKETELIDLAREVATDIGLSGSDILPAVAASGGNS